MSELNLEKNKNNHETAEVWQDLWKEAILAGCDDGFKEKLSGVDWKVSKEQPGEIKNHPRFLIDKFALGKTTIWELLVVLTKEDYPPQLLIEAYGGDIIKTIIFQNENDEYFDLSQLLPVKSYFIREKSFSCGQMKSKDGYFYIIMYNKKLLRNDSGFLSFLHEIGHAHIREKTDETIYNKKIIEPIMNAKFLLKTELIDKYSDEDRAVLLQNERNAWAWAIKTARELRKKGIDLIPGLGKEKIKKWIYDEMRLGSYEYQLDITPNALRNVRKEKLVIFKNELH